MKKRAHKGRPKKPAATRRVALTLSLYPDDAKKLKRLAKSLGITESETVRRLIREA